MRHYIREQLLQHIDQNSIVMSTTPQFVTVTLRKAFTEYDTPFFSAEADGEVVDGWNICQPSNSHLTANEWYNLVRSVFKDMEFGLFSFPVPTSFIIE